MFGIGKLGRVGGVRTTLASLLAKYGTNAHVYLPGIGTVSGLTAGNYLDSAGTTAATVDNPVGLSLDALQAMTLGAELVTNGTFSTDTSGWTAANAPTISVSAGKVSITNNGATNGLIYQAMPTTVGKTYRISGDVVFGGGFARIEPSNAVPTSVGGSGINVSSSGSYTFDFVASVATTYIVVGNRNDPGATNTFDNISVREIPGIHATQATTANKAILRQSGGKYSWQFDGSNDSLNLSAPLFQMSDDHCVIAGVNQTIAANGYVFSQNNTAATTLVGAIAVTSGGFARALWGDDIGTTAFITGSVPITGVTKVITVIKRTNAKQLRVNGAQDGATNNTAMGATTLNTASIGSYTTAGNFTGSIYPVIAIKGTVTDADLLALERLVGQLMGITI